MSTMDNAFVHDTPKALNGIEVGRVGRLGVQFHAALRKFKPWLRLLGKKIRRIVEYGVNCGFLGEVFLNLFRQLKGDLNIDLFALDAGESESFEIKCARKIKPLATRCGFNRRLLTLREPPMRWTALIFGMHGVRKQQKFLTRKQRIQQCLVPVVKCLLCNLISLRCKRDGSFNSFSAAS